MKLEGEKARGYIPIMLIHPTAATRRVVLSWETLQLAIGLCIMAGKVV